MEELTMKNKIKELYKEYKGQIDACLVFGGISVGFTALTTLAHFGIKKLLNVR